ncbi:MAG: hypothetical protein QOF83_2762 [Solirubrobacteraceae bacterium]|nr:hypothetical protein [Solirubrobacteraceae bacterium]
MKGRTKRAVPRQTTVRDPQWDTRSITWLEDQFVEAYVCWREACGDVEGAYALLDGSQRKDRGLALAAFAAALDREESAAGAYHEAADTLSRAVDHDTVVVPSA